MKHRRPLIDLPDGSYRIEQELIMARNPPAVRPPLPLKEVGYFLITVLVGFGVLLGILVVCGFAACFWVLGKIWRAVK